MSFKKILSVMLSLCLLLTVFAALPSTAAQALSADIVVIDSASAVVRSDADPLSAQSATAAQNNTFLLLDTKTGSDGELWYKIFYSSSISGWVSSEDASATAASSTVNDPYTLYLKRAAQVIVPTFALREKPGSSNAAVVTLTQNERMVVLGYDDDPSGITWYEVRYGNTNGWIIRTAVSITNICTSPAPLDCSSKVPVIYLSPSRQPANLFAVGNTNEWEQMTRVADTLKVILEERYECIVHMADYETPISKFDRPLEARLLGADIYLAIHSNATGTSNKVNGTQSYYYPGSSQSRKMAENLVESISAIAPFPDQAEGAINGMTYLGGVGYGEVRDPSGFGMISNLLEVEFHDRADSAQWIIDNTEGIAEAIADGLDKTFDFKPKGSTPTTTTTAATSPATTTTTASTTIPSAPVQDGHSPIGTTTTTTTSTTSTTTSTISTTSSTTSTTTTSTTASTTIPSTAPTTAPTTFPAQIVRAGGENRIDTAAKISAMGWNSAETVIIASGSSYPDALAGVSLSYAADAPILLTMDEDGAEKELLAEIVRLDAKRAYILGGEAAVSANTEKSLTDAGVACTRLAGADRYETSVLIAKELARLTGGSFDNLYFASADNFPDALAISPVAAIEGNPILYVGSDSNLQPCVAQYSVDTGCRKAILLGGEAAVSNTGKASIESLSISVERISGADRYATSLAISERFSSVFDGDGVALATGKNFPDALAGGAHAAKLGIPVLLVGNDADTTLLTFAASRDSGDVYVYGGVNAVSDAVAQAVLAVIG